MFTAKDVMTLREMTNAGMMDCKRALTECDGDMEKAKDYLREKGLAAVAKKAGRIAAEGVVDAVVGASGKDGVIVEVNCETDFVALTDEFKKFVHSVAQQIDAAKPAYVSREDAPDGAPASAILLEQASVSDPSMTVEQLLSTAVAKIGEKISIRRFVRYEAGTGVVDSYIHMGGKIGVLLEVNCETDAAAQNEEFKQLVHNVAMQIAAAKPTCVSKSEVKQDDLEKEKEILRAQAKNEPKPKPDAIIEKMVEGRIEKYYKEVCLLEQPYVKDTDMSVQQLLNSAGSKLGEKLSVRRFVRYEMGEGLQKREDNFAAEVMGQIKK